MTTLMPPNPDYSASKIWNEMAIDLDAVGSAAVLNYWSGGLILANMSMLKVPELIIQVNGLKLESSGRCSSSVHVAGLDLWFEDLAFNGETVASMVLVPKNAEQKDLFYALADHLVPKLALNPDLPGTSDSLEAAISEWMKFWAKERNELSRELLLGLLGELIALDEYLNLEGKDYTVWEGPLGSPKDFRGMNDALEVKVMGTRTGPVVHRISSIQQLQIPENGRLFVLSLRIVFSANGKHSFADLVSRVSDLQIFQSLEGKSRLKLALESAGYRSNLPVDLSRFDVFDSGVYEVLAGFPRLTEADITADARVLDITYSVDFSGSAEFLLPDSGAKLQLN